MVELRRSRTRLRLSLTIWTLSLELARLRGWVPAGTRQVAVEGQDPVDPLHDVRHMVGWQTEYRSSDGQTVTEKDARQIADCLTKAVVDGERMIDDLSTGKIPPIPGIRTEARGFQWFTTPEGKTHLQNLIDFCRDGAFQIF